MARETYNATRTFAALAPSASRSASSSLARMHEREPQARPGSCQLNRRRAEGGTQRLWLSECRDIIMVAGDGSFAVIGQGGAPHRYETYGGGMLSQDYFDALIRVDLRTGERMALGGERLSRPKVSGDGRTVCGSPHDAFIRGQRELVRCQRDGGRPISLALPQSPRWNLLNLSHDGRWLAASTSSLSPRSADVVEDQMHVLPVANNARPVFSVPGQMLSWVWLPGSERVALSVEHANITSAYVVDVAEGWSARLGEQRRSDQMVGLRPVGARADELILVRTRGANKPGADVWRVTVSRPTRGPARPR